MRRASFAIIGAAALAAPAAAQTVEFSAFVRGEVGYGTNPLLSPGETQGAGLGSFSVSPRLVYRTALSTTTLSGTYSRDQYFTHYGNTESFNVGLNRTDQVTARLTSALTVGFVTTNRALSYDSLEPISGSPLDVGQRSRNLSGSEELQWQMGANDSISFGGNGAWQTYGRNSSEYASGYRQFGGNVGYNRTIDARTSIGVQTSVSEVHSDLYPNSRSIQPALTAKRQLSAIWTLDGHVGVVLQKIGGPFGESNASIGFGLSLCGQYTRTSICLSGDRDTAPSGFGGLRKDLSFSANVSHTLTEHSRFSVSATYDDSRSSQPSLPSVFGKVRGVRVFANYNRDLTRRISAGVGGRYQTRHFEVVGDAHNIAGTVNITAKLGRI